MKKEIVKPSYSKPYPDIITGCDTSECYIFDCLICKEKVKLAYKEQIFTNNEDRNITKEECDYLKEFYNIGYVGKSHDGGAPIFGKIYCEKCKANYFTYTGVSEPLNSCYHIYLQGIMLVERE